MKHKTFPWKRIVLRAVLAALFLPLVAAPAAAQTEPEKIPYYLPIILNSRPGNPVQTGIATYYDATGDGNCMFGPSPSDLMVAAMNQEEYAGSAACGSHILVNGPKGSVTVRIVDRCPECLKGHLDLSREAFARIADLPQGRVNITWQVISPDIPGPIAYHFKEGSNQWWTAVQVRNHRNPVAKLEYFANGQWINVPRENYNFFVRASGMGPGPYSFRVTDIYGNVLVDHNIPHMEGGTINGTGQFPYGP